MVECTGLENRRTERYRGFESLSLRTESCKSKDLQDFFSFVLTTVPLKWGQRIFRVSGKELRVFFIS